MNNEQKIVQEVLGNLRIENPCPMILARMRGETDAEYYCKSCEKTITDFRNCSDEEIAQSLLSDKSKEICGIFSDDQLAGQHRVHYNFLQKSAYYALILLSFIGFSVKPLNAQTVKEQPETETKKGKPQKECTGDSSTKKVRALKTQEKTRPKRKNVYKRRRGKRGRTAGLPSW